MQKWNEFQTFTQRIIPFLKGKGLHYPPRESAEHFDEQRWVRKRGAKKGPYDGAYKDPDGVILLIEAKREGASLDRGAIEQAQDYALGGTFPVPPPFLLVSNGDVHRWFHRKSNRDGSFTYDEGDPVPWRQAIHARKSGELTVELTLDKATSLLKQIRREIYEDLSSIYFPNGYNFNKSALKHRRTDFEKIFETRKTFVDPTLSLSKEQEARAIQAILSSIALSWTLKLLFIKILMDLRGESVPRNIRATVAQESAKFPGILKAEPYDKLPFSDTCEERLLELVQPIRLTRAIVFDVRENQNPIGLIWDALVDSEELDLQVKSLGNVYTTPEIVKEMVFAAGKQLGDWKDKRVLEPACGSGHFIRECYHHMIKAEVGSRGGPDPRSKMIRAHKKVLANLRAVDIDPFAVQTSQLGMFLELYRKPGVWQALAPRNRFDFDKIVSQGDSLSVARLKQFKKFEPDLIIGNPPYGVSVTDPEIEKRFQLGSPDSYGYFIAQAVEALGEKGHLFFIVSSTFLTTRTHIPLRRKIAEGSTLRSVYTVHRNAFPGRDVFCCLLHLSSKRLASPSATFRYCDAWPISPSDPNYLHAMEKWSGRSNRKLPETLYSEYEIMLDLLALRVMPPHPNEVEKAAQACAPRSLLDRTSVVYPIFGGLPSLSLLCADLPYRNQVKELSIKFPSLGDVDALAVKRQAKVVPIVKLWQLAQVRQGLVTADDNYFLRKTPGVIPNARRRSMKDVNPRCTITPKQLADLSGDHKTDGIPVIDPQRDRYFVPFDKGGEQDTAAGELRAFWSPIDYWINWSEQAVKELKRRNKFPPGTSKKPRLQNVEHYFKLGIRFTRAGLYAPMYELSFGGVFSDKGSLILPFDARLAKFLLTVLCSPLARYLTKNFLQHSVMTEIDIIRQIPIVVPTARQLKDIEKICDKILAKKQKGHSAEKEMQAAWRLVYGLYRIPKADQKEIDTWFKRRYPNFGRNRPTSGASPKARGSGRRTPRQKR